MASEGEPNEDDANHERSGLTPPGFEALGPAFRSMVRIDPAVQEAFKRLSESLTLKVDWAALKAAAAAIETARPPNLREIDIEKLEAVAAMAVDDGIPVAWVPRGPIVENLVAASGADRFRLLVDRGDEALDDCGDILDQQELRTRFAELCREAVACYRDGRKAAAQSLAANIVESLVQQEFDKSAQKVGQERAAQAWLDTTFKEMSIYLTVLPLVEAFVSWKPRYKQRPIPTRFSRNVTSHGLARQGACTQTTALVAIMLATSLTVQLAPKSGIDN